MADQSLIQSDADHDSSPYAAPPSEMTAGEYQKLVHSIATEGLHVPVVLYENHVLEGRRRYRACIETGVTAEFREWGTDPDDGDDPAAWALARSSRGLSPTETARLEECERTIEQGLATFVAVGRALLEVREGRLWRQSYSSFEEWAQERFDLGRRHADRTIAATQVVALLSAAAATPRSEAVARELAPLREQPEDLRECWETVLDRHGERPTAAQAHEVVRERLPNADSEPDAEGHSDADPAPPPNLAPESVPTPPNPDADDETAGEAPDARLDDWGDEGQTGPEQHAGAIHALLGFLDAVPELPGAITLAERMSPDQRRHALAGLDAASEYLNLLKNAAQTSR